MEQKPLLKVQQNRRVYLPSEMAATLGIFVGDYIQASLEGGAIVLRPVTVMVKAGARKVENEGG